MANPVLQSAMYILAAKKVKLSSKRPIGAVDMSPKGTAMNMKALEDVFKEEFDQTNDASYALATYRRSYALALMELATTEGNKLAAFAEAEEMAEVAENYGIPRSQLRAIAYQLRRSLAEPVSQ